MKIFENKKGQEQNSLVVLILALVLFVVLLSGAVAFSMYFKNKWSDSTCRTSVIANSKVRAGGVTKWFSNDENIPVSCPRGKDWEISYASVKGKTGSDVTVAYNVMTKVAEEMADCHYKYAGDMDIIPFENENGKYCGICREISFDEKIQSRDYGSESGKGIIDDFYSYLMNSKMKSTNQYYSEYIFGYVKEETSKEKVDMKDKIKLDMDYAKDNLDPEVYNKLKGLNLNDISRFDIPINTSEKYYVAHVVLKGKNNFNDFIGELGENRREKTLGCGVVGALLAAAIITTPLTGGMSVGLVVGGLGIGGGLMTTCYGGLSTFFTGNKELASYRVTTIIPTSSLDNLGCIPYGLDKDEET